MSISVYTHSDCLKHDTGSTHPESSQRLSTLLNGIQSSDLVQKIHLIDAPLGTDSQILLAHSQEHLNTVLSSAPDDGYSSIDGDTILSPGSIDAARRGVGAACLAVDELCENLIDTAFCATRPPGHHATFQQAMGFCLFNNAAIACLYAKEKYQIDRIVLIDFDVHHGNGSQDIISQKEGVLYISTHLSPLYPGSGSTLENRPNKVLNVPFSADTTGSLYRSTFSQRIIPAINAYSPQLMIVSAGFDAHKNDPLGGMGLTEDDFFWIGEKIQELANYHCKGKILSILEGGYNLEHLEGSIHSYLKGLLASQKL